MRLTDLFQNNNIKPDMTDSARMTDPSQRMQNAANALRGLSAGQLIEGEVVSRQGDNVQLKLSEDVQINAKVDSDIHVDLGKLLTFEVKSSGNNVTLSPLFTNTSTETPVMRALDMANIPFSEKTMSMTGEMMKAGLPIDKNILQTVYRESKMFPDADIKDIVDLHRLGLPVNESSVSQIAAYKNLSHQILEGMNDILEEIPGVCDELIQENNPMDAGRLMGQLIDVALAEEGAAELPTEAEQMGEAGETHEGLISEQSGNVQTGEAQNVSGQSVGRSVVIQENGEVLQLGATEETAASGIKENEISPMSQALQEILKNPESTDAEKLEQLSQLLKQATKAQDKEALKEIVQNQTARNLIKTQLKANFTISPRELENPGKVEELYERLDRQLKGLSKAFEDVAKTDTTAFKAVNNMNQNLDFLNQINQVYNYVQLPLRFQQSENHGDLYVYTNKKNLAEKEGEISALLHLDMEHLGPVDVYVAMEQTKVKTNFYVQDDEMLDFLEAHMDLLTKRLSDRGYDISVKTQTREDLGKNPDGLGALKPLNPQQKSGTMLQKMSFDVRA